MANRKLPLSFYQQSDVVDIARQLVGKVLCTKIDGTLTSGIIVETEAYCGSGDKASHANNGTRTDRTETMYQAGGIAYVYLCYGIHHLFNVVTNSQGNADAILIRGIEPLEGTEKMLERRSSKQIQPALTAGPGRLTQALGITTDSDGISLTGNVIWIEDRNINFPNNSLVASKRIGVDYAEEDANLPWRFYPKGSKWISKK